MPRTFSERRTSSLSRLAAFVPAIAAFAAAGSLRTPTLVLSLLLLANVLTMWCICRVWGFARNRALARSVGYGSLLVSYTIVSAMLIGYSLSSLLQTGSLVAALGLSGASVIALLLLWRFWPAFGLIYICRTSRDHRAPAGSLKQALTRAWRITELNDLYFSHGLLVALCLLSLSQGALALSGLYGALPHDILLPALAAYALVLAPVGQWVIAARSANALRTEAHRLRDDRAAPLLTTPIAVKSEQATAVLDTPDIDSMLLRCARAGQIELALAALERGADANARAPADDRDQRTPLVLAAVSPDLRLLRALIVKRADLNRNEGGLTALLAATRDSHEGRPDAVMTLLTNGADPRCTDAAGNTPLHYAALTVRPIIAALLCDADAPLEAVNRDGQTPLAVACSAANWELARFLLERGARTEPEHAQPALLAAAMVADDDPTGIKLLLKRRARVDAPGRLARTALMTASLNGHAAIAKALLDAGAHIDLADAHGTTALMEAARSGAVDVLDVFAGHTLNADLCDMHGRTALIIASKSKQACELAVEKLLALGASPHIAAADGRRAVDYAAAAGRWNIVRRLDPDYEVPANLAPESTPLDSAAHLLDALRFAHWHIVDNFAESIRAWPPADGAQLFLALLTHADAAPRRWLLNHGLHTDTPLSAHGSLLRAAFAQLPQALPAAFDLLHSGAQPAGGDTLQRICAALTNGDAPRQGLETCALLALERGADMFALDEAGRTPLVHAIACGSRPITQALIDRGADVNARDRTGRTPLFAALQLPGESAHVMVKVLLAAGADAEAAAANGETPLGIALARADPELQHWLNWPGWKLPRRALRGTDLIAAAASGDAAAVDKLLALGLAADSTDVQGATALLRAAGNGHAALVALLLERGADPAHAAASGATALSAAVSARQDQVIDTLLSSAVAADQRLPGGGTCLMIAAALGYPEIIARLLAKGADANIQDERGQRALHAAAQYAFSSDDDERAQRTLQLLLEHGADVNAANASGQTALLLLLGARAEPGARADQRRLLTLLPLLLTRRADVNAQDKRGVSALHACAMHGLLLPTRTVLAAGADPDVRDMLDRSPRQIAHLLGFIDVAAELGAAAAPIPGAAQTLRQPARGPA